MFGWKEKSSTTRKINNRTHGTKLKSTCERRKTKMIFSRKKKTMQTKLDLPKQRIFFPHLSSSR